MPSRMRWSNSHEPNRSDEVMNDKAESGIHWSFWAITVVALIWNVLGGVNFFAQMDADTVATFPESHRAIIEGRPIWATAGFALGVFGGSFGCVLLLLRKSAALYVFILSLLGMIVTMIHTIGVGSSKVSFSPVEIIVMIVMPLLVAAFLVWYSRLAENKD